MLKRAFLLAFTTLILVNPSANAHTALVSSNPKSNAMLKSSPKYISITFNEELIEIAGKPVSKYKVTYRVISADGHPVSGSFNFWVH